MKLRRKNFIQNKNNSSKKIKKSSIGLFALILIVTGVCFLGYDYFISKKDKIYEAMNLLLFDDETPEHINHNKTGSNLDADPDRTKSADEEIKYNYQYIGVLEIPKIGLKRGFVDVNSKYNNVSRNITIIESSSFPDQENGNFILAAHSGNCYVCFFNKLWKLSKGDIAIVYYSDIKYTYNIVDIYDVNKTGTVEIRRDSSKKTLTLITCTHNSDTKQTIYILELVSEE